METWRKVLRDGFFPVLPTPGLQFAAELLRNDDKRLLQGANTTPPSLNCVKDWPCEAACIIGVCGLGNGAETVGEVEQFFAKSCFDADQKLGVPAECRHFLNWFDDTPRDEVRRQLLPEIESELKRRTSP